MRHGLEMASLLGMSQVMLAAGLWATVGVATQIVPEASALSAAVFGTFRMALGGLAILGVAWLLSPDLPAALRRLAPGALAAFALSSATFQVCLFQSFALLGVTGTVVATVCLPPVLSTLATHLKGASTPSRGAVVALGLAVAGVLLFAWGDMAGDHPSARARGLAVAVLAAVAFVCMTAAARSLGRTAGPLVVSGAGLTLSGLILAASLPLAGFQTGLSPSDLTGELVALVLYLGLGPTALAYLLYCAGIAKCRSTDVGLVASMIEPAIAALLAYLILRETLTPQEIAGCLLIVLGMVWLAWSERKPAAA